MKTALVSAGALILILFTASLAHPAFALKNFFACITDISNRDGGDHNLTAQQVLDCFKKEFPSNDQSLSSHSFSHSSIFQGHSSSTIDNIINGHHFHSQIIN